MFQLRPEHLIAFDCAVRREWHWQLTDAMRELFIEETKGLSDDLLLERVAKADRVANEFRITSRDAILRFVGLTFLAGEFFYQNPAVAKSLGQPSVDNEWLIREAGALLPATIRDCASAMLT